MSLVVPISRTFSAVTPENDGYEEGWLEAYWGLTEPKTWSDLEAEYRVIILADAGAGKTFETLARAENAAEQGRPAFFIRIEDLDADFEGAFEVGSSDQFEIWLSSSVEAWFFLDSVDEAKLDNPRAFEKAIRLFANRIRPAMHRAHIVITSRPYAWRFKADKELVERLLPFDPVQKAPRDLFDPAPSEEADASPDGPLNIYGLKPLSVEDIRQFAQHHDTPNIDRLIIEIQRTNLLEMASRPFDLEGLLLKWEADGELGGRLESLQYIIDLRLREIDPNREQRQPLNRDKAREGARLLAAAVTLTGKAGVLVPDITHEKAGIDAEEVLADWNPNDVRALLERGVFNGILYGAVRFRNREIRELLTAEWLHSLLERGGSRRQVESLLFREQYGEQVIVQRLKPVLPWLILFDETICQRTLVLQPEIAVEGGDAACLSLSTRQRILNDIVSRIVADEDDRSARDNTAIARIAQQDLSEDVQRLIVGHQDNDDAIFFLARVVWQGSMVDCLNPLMSIAADAQRSIYPRIASARAVSIIGTDGLQKTLWRAINEQPDTVPRSILAELIEGAASDDSTVDLLIASIDKLPPYEEYETSGLDRALHAFLGRLTELTSQQREPLLARLCDGFNNFLNRKPYHERRECRVSTNFTWLMGPANHAAEMLVVDHADACFSDTVMSILLKIPAVKYQRSSRFDEHKSTLQQLIPAWAEFNDTLFWRSIEETRAWLTKKGKRLTDDWPVQCLGHYWRFEADSFPRTVAFIQEREFEDNQLVALSLAFRIHEQAERPADWEKTLLAVVANNETLENGLDQLLNPIVSEEQEQWKQESLEDEQRWEKERLEQERDQSQWIERLRANPDIVRDPPELPPGEMTNDQYWLLRKIDGEGLSTERGRGSDWRLLMAEFGEDVAYAFRDAAIRHWRVYTPGLRSEGADTTSVPYSLIFAMTGLEFESRDIADFPGNLTGAEVSHALRYLMWELNGFPSWLEIMYKAHPGAVLESVWQELNWELERIQSDTSKPDVLHDITYHAPWLHRDLASGIQHWVEGNPQASTEALRHCFQILDNTQVAPSWFAILARSKIIAADDLEELPIWYALWVDTEPETGIAEVQTWLSNLDAEPAEQAAQQFIVQLLGGRQCRGGGTFVCKFKTVTSLKELYVLMHQHIKVEEDIDRAGKGAYSPGLRDDSQDARNQLFNLLTEIPGKATYVALLELAQSHPVASHRPWMAKQAQKRAEQDADLEPWTARQVHDFSSSLEMEPTSHRQLFDIGVLHLNEFKDWLELGNDSLYETYQRVGDETEMRKVVANWINEHAQRRYTCAQENPLANDQRPDIWLQHPQVNSPVPIELKLLDKGWSGPKLCERLRNQLAGDYLREETAGCGVFLLIWQGTEPGRRWEVEGNLVDVSGLGDALSTYWSSISNQFPNVSDIDIIVIDLTIRALKSDI